MVTMLGTGGKWVLPLPWQQWYTWLALLTALWCSCSQHGHAVWAAKVARHTACMAQVNNRIINLQPLQRTDGLPRFKVEYNGWNYTFNPCIAFNYPSNPSAATGDQCHYVAICKSRLLDNSQEEAYAVGLQRSARFKSPSLSKFYDDRTERDSEEVEEEKESSEEGDEDEEDDDEDDSDEDSGKEDLSSSEEELNNTDTSYPQHANTTYPDGTNVNITVYAIDKGNGSTHIISHSKTDPANIPSSSSSSQIKNDSTSSLDTVTEPSIEDEPQHRKEPTRLPLSSAESEASKLRLHKIMNTTFLVFRGERSHRHSRVYVALRCDYTRVLADDALLKPFPLFYLPYMVFELYHYCCCPDACAFTEQWQLEVLARSNISNQDGVAELGPSSGPRHMWLILVCNLIILIMAVFIGGVCCRKGGSAATTSYYSYLPALHSSHTTLSGLESGLSQQPKMHVPSADYLDYSSNIIKSKELPKLSNCLISSHSLEIGHRLGGGIFGDTYLGEWKDRPIAAKRITAGHLQGQLQKDMDHFILHDTTILSKQRHKHLAAVLGVCTDMRQPYIITEYIDGEPFKELLKRKGEASMKMSKRIKLLSQTSDAIGFLHSAKPPILHRDLRCANILVDRSERAKIVDYGLTRITQRLRKQCTALKECFCQRDRSAIPAFTRWTAPEILCHPTADESNFDVFSPAVDAYSFGMVLWEVVSLTDPFEEISDDEEVQAIVRDGGRPRWDLLTNLAPQYRDLMRACWDQNQDARPTMKKIHQHLKGIEQMFSRAGHIRLDTYSLRGSLSSLFVSSEMLRRKPMPHKDPERKTSVHSVYSSVQSEDSC